jgi:seryl-tRNA synthetase
MASKVTIFEEELNRSQVKNERLSEQMQQKIAKLRKEAKEKDAEQQKKIARLQTITSQVKMFEEEVSRSQTKTNKRLRNYKMKPKKRMQNSRRKLHGFKLWLHR